jgi:hypothetical protein
VLLGYWLCHESSPRVCPIQSCLVETVPLSEENQNWVREEIRAAINPNGWKKTANWLRYWSLTGICITAFLALIAIIITVGIYATNRVSQESEFRGTTQVRLTNIETRLGGIETNILALRAAQAANLPTDKKNIAEAKAVLDAAKRSAIKLPTNIVEQSGRAFIEAAAKEPAAWNVALDFLNYRSTLNVYDRTFNPVNVPAGSATAYDIGPDVAGKPLPILMHVPFGVAPKDAARFETIGQNLNQQLQFGSAQLMLTGGAVSLDDKYVRHAVFVGVEVHYTGRPLILQDALFVNCTFIFDNTQPGRQLGQVLLASSTVNFEKAS